MSDIEWPEGATHRIDGDFTKWDDGIEFNLMWRRVDTSWSLKRYKESRHAFEIIERPKEPEAKEPVINWDEQPTPEYSAIVSNIHDNAVLWMRHIGGGSYQHDDGRIYQDSRMFTVYEKPEPYKPEVGEWCEVYNKSFERSEWERCEPLFIGKFKVVYNSESCTERVCTVDLLKFRPIKSERMQFIERAMKATNGDESDSMLRDLFDDMYQAGFEAPKDNKVGG